ncbi:hypothetical protein AB0P36_00720 [Streptomyces flavidovirens]|uniref:hypothetical protein n=1 Tax=Streptomyces flavidovirens TaxID=67298 RepID=UPI0034250E57
MSRYQVLLTHIVPELVMERRIRRSAGSRLRKRGGPPVIVVAGLDAAEQAEVLRRLHHRYRRVLPVNDSQVPLDQREVIDFLLRLSTRAYGLGGYAWFRKPMSFPRFTLGMLAYSWADEHRPDLRAIAEGHTWLRHQLRTARDADEGHQARARLRAELAPYLAGAGAGRTGIAVGLLFTLLGHQAPRPDKTALRWWGRLWNVPRGAFSWQDAVATELFTVFHAGRDEDGHTVEHLLTAALLADIDAYYGRYRRFNRARPPLLLVPEAHTQAGTTFLTALATAYDIVWRAPRHTGTRPVVIAVGGDSAGARGRPPLGRLEHELNEWSRRPADGPEGRWLLAVRVGADGDGEGQ